MSASFDDSNLVSRAGLVPVMTLAERAGLVREHVRIAAKTGAFAEIKVGAVPTAHQAEDLSCVSVVERCG